MAKKNKYAAGLPSRRKAEATKIQNLSTEARIIQELINGANISYNTKEENRDPWNDAYHKAIEYLDRNEIPYTKEVEGIEVDASIQELKENGDIVDQGAEGAPV